MPFDASPITFEQADGRTRLRMLADALRGKMPEGFRWDFERTFETEDCGSTGCAMGLAHIIWPAHMASATSYVMAEVFGLSLKAATSLFIPNISDAAYGAMTPRMVADAIDRYLETGRVEYMPAGAGDGQRSPIPSTAEERAHEKRSSGNIDGRPGRSGVPAHAEGVVG